MHHLEKLPSLVMFHNMSQDLVLSNDNEDSSRVIAIAPIAYPLANFYSWVTTSIL